jgi:hypothetical protein
MFGKATFEALCAAYPRQLRALIRSRFAAAELEAALRQRERADGDSCGSGALAERAQDESPGMRDLIAKARFGLNAGCLHQRPGWPGCGTSALLDAGCPH